jgi:hypothetical protein
MDLGKAVATWQRVSGPELGALNALLKNAGKSAIPSPSAAIKAPTC